MSQAERVGSPEPAACEANPNSDQGSDEPVNDALPQALQSELDRRVSELATYSPTTFGPLGARDWALTIGLFVVLPLALVWVLR